MHKPKESLSAVNNIITQNVPGIRLYSEEWGDLIASFKHFPKLTDFTPILKKLQNEVCGCPHWGYILKGAIGVRYTDGSEEVLKTGDLFYLPGGHTLWAEEDTDVIEFSPTKEFKAEVLKLSESIAKTQAGS